MPLPELSPAVTLALNAGQKSSDVFNQLLKECAIYYMAKYPTMSDSAYYQAIGKKMISKFPCLAFVDGTNPWVKIIFIKKTNDFIYPYKQTWGGVYRNHSVCPSVCDVCPYTM